MRVDTKAQGEIVTSYGATAVTISGAELFMAFNQNTIDASLMGPFL